MTANKVKQWIIALLSADASVTANFEDGAGSVVSSNQDFPSDPGVYVKISGSAPSEARGFEAVDVQACVVVDGSESDCYDAVEDVRNAVYRPAGTPGVFGVDPSSVGLSVRSVSAVTLQVTPEAAGSDRSYISFVTFKVVGRDDSSPD